MKWRPPPIVRRAATLARGITRGNGRARLGTEEREKGIDAGFTVARQLLRGWLAEEGRYLYALPVVRVILTDLDKGKMSSGMRQGVIHASSIHMPIEFRAIGWGDRENAPEREDEGI